MPTLSSATGVLIIRAFNLFMTVFNLLILARIIFSFVRPYRGTFLGQLDSISWRLTEPILGPIRRMLPQTMGLDFSPFIALLLLQFIQSALFQVVQTIFF